MFHPSPLSELKERNRRTDCARAAAMAVAGNTACGEVGESARRKAERRSVDRESVKLNSMTFSAQEMRVTHNAYPSLLYT